MITQVFTQGKNRIKIESAESIQDANDNKFKNGEFSRFYINDVKVDNYMSMMRYIIEETKKNKEKVAQNKENLILQRKHMMENQKKIMSEQLMQLREQYKDMNISPEYMQIIDEYIEKTDEYGVRRIK